MIKKQILNKPNELISLISEKKITMVQKKLYNFFLKNAQDIIKFDNNYNQINENSLYSFSVPCSLTHNFANIGIKDFEYIEKELEELMKIVVNVADRENKKNWYKFHLISIIKKTENNYEYFLIGNIVKALKEQSFFTTLDLVITNSLNSRYSIIFYELAIRYKKYKIPRMSIEEIRELTNTKENYKAIKDFKKYVLETACNEISEKTDINLSYETIKTGRNIAFIDFFIEIKKEKQVEQIETSEIKEKEDSIELIELFNLCKTKTDEIKKILYKSLIKFNYEYVKSNVLYTNKNSKENYTVYLKNSLKNDYSLEERTKQIKKEEQKQKIQSENEKLKQDEVEKEEQNKQEIKELIEYFTEQEKEKHYNEYLNDKYTLKEVVSFENYLIVKIDYDKILKLELQKRKIK